MRIGVLGTGRIGLMHARNLAQTTSPRRATRLCCRPNSPGCRRVIRAGSIIDLD